MDNSILEKVYDLKDAIDEDPRVLDLLMKEKNMEENEEVMVLSYRYSRAQDEYNDALKHFQEDSDEMRKYQKKLYEAKQQLESHYLVREYLKSYKEVRLMYKEIEDLIITPFLDQLKCKNNL